MPSCIRTLYDFLEKAGARNLEWIGEGADEERIFQYVIDEGDRFTHRIYEEDHEIKLLCAWTTLPADPCARTVMMDYLLRHNQGLYTYLLIDNDFYLQAVHPKLADCDKNIIDNFLVYEAGLLQRIGGFQHEQEAILDLVEERCLGRK